ncbi:hypothetical protein, partial [Romboutsia lituseburensis]
MNNGRPEIEVRRVKKDIKDNLDAKLALKKKEIQERKARREKELEEKRLQREKELELKRSLRKKDNVDKDNELAAREEAGIELDSNQCIKKPCTDIDEEIIKDPNAILGSNSKSNADANADANAGADASADADV